MRVYVTANDIQLGERGEEKTCPIARSLRRRGYPSKVGTESVWFSGGKSSLPRTARRFIKRFDSGAVVRPFSFKLTVPK